MNNTTLNFDPDFGLDDSFELLRKLRGDEPAHPFDPAPLPELTGIALYETPTNNHGCRGFDVRIEPITATTGKVISGSGCSSCWQVGHDNPASPIEVGTIVSLPDWCANWEEAQSPFGRSHNELVDDSDEEPQSDCSLVRPSDLILQ